MIELNRGDWARNVQPALYSMIWASIMMTPVAPGGDAARWEWQEDVRDLLTYFKNYFPEDSWLVEKYLYPMYDNFALPAHPGGLNARPDHFPVRSLQNELLEISNNDRSSRPARRRSALPRGVVVRYRVGQVFKHRRYNYHGIILGWTLDGGNGTSPGPPSSSGGSHTPAFYRCMYVLSSPSCFFSCFVEPCV